MGQAYANFSGCFDHQILSDLPAAERRSCMVAIVGEIRDLLVCPIEAMRLMLMELEYSGFAELTGISLDQALADSEAGAQLSRMREHASNLARQRSEQVQYESQAERREQEKRRDRESRAKERSQKKALRDEQRRIMITHLQQMSPIERLKVIASCWLWFPLDAIPQKLIGIHANIISQLDHATRDTLLRKIGPRRGRWREIANYIRQQG